MGSPPALHTRRYKAFLARLRLARQESGLTQEQAAEQLGRTQDVGVELRAGFPARGRLRPRA